MKRGDNIDDMPLSREELAQQQAVLDRRAQMRVHAAARAAADADGELHGEHSPLRQQRHCEERSDEAIQSNEPTNRIASPPAGARNDDTNEPEKPKKKKKQSAIGSVLSGNILSNTETRKAYPYLIFCALLMFLYIANAFRGQSIYREHAALTEQVKELRSQSMTIASQKMQATRQSAIMAELERRGIPLKESLTPNRVIPRQ